MSVKFFGQFLLESGEVDPGHLREAIRLMNRTNKRLGTLAVEAGMVSEADTMRVNKAQLRTDRPFGELAVELGVLQADQLEELVRRQETRRLRVGQALVQLGHLSEDRLGPLLDGFKADQAPYQSSGRDLPAGLSSSRLAGVVIDLLPRFCMRVARIRVKIGPNDPEATATTHGIAVGISVRGGHALDIVLAADREFAELLAAGISGGDPADLDDELVIDGVGEFLNVLAGNAVAVLEREGFEAELEPPRPVELPIDGHRFQLVATSGQADLILTQFQSQSQPPRSD